MTQAVLLFSGLVVFGLIIWHWITVAVESLKTIYDTVVGTSLGHEYVMLFKS